MTIDEISRYVISMMYSSKDTFTRVINSLKEEHFVDDTHKNFFKELNVFFKKYKNIPSLNEMPCDFYIIEEPPNLEWAINELKALRRKNLLKETLSQAAVQVSNSNVNKAIGELNGALSKISTEESEEIEVCDFADNLLYTYTEMVKRRKNGCNVKYHITKLDEIVDGIYNDEIIYLTGEPKAGKSLMVCYVAYNNLKSGRSVGYFNLDQGKDLTISTFLSLDTGIKRKKIHKGDLTLAEKQEVLDSIQRFAKEYGKLVIIDGALDVAKIHNFIISNSFDLVIIDQLSNVGNKGRNYLDQAANAARELHNIKKRTQVPMIVISQLGRSFAKDKGEGHVPEREHVAFTDCINQTADGVFSLYRDANNIMTLGVVNFRREEFEPKTSFKFEWNFPNIKEIEEEWYNKDATTNMNQFLEEDFI